MGVTPRTSVRLIWAKGEPDCNPVGGISNIRCPGCRGGGVNDVCCCGACRGTGVSGCAGTGVEEAAASISRETGIEDYRVLYSTTEFKKIRLPYFTPDYDRWEELCAQAGAEVDAGAGAALPAEEVLA